MPSIVIEKPGETVAAVVRDLLGLPWSKAKALCVSGRVTIDGQRVVDPAIRVAAGATVSVSPTATKLKKGVIAREAILHQDEEIIVVSKAAGMLTVPYDEERDTLVDQVRAHLRAEKKSGTRDPMVGVVQRLDKDTTGVLVFARTMSAKRALQDQLREHTVHRRYLAIVHGVLAATRFESDLVPDRGDGLRGSWGTRSKHQGRLPSNAKRSITHVTVERALRGATLVTCRLETGRQHQIRIHLAEAGHPLVGETVYIRDYRGTRIEAPRPMLHAIELGFEHPKDGRTVRFSVPPPEDFASVLSALSPSASVTR